MDFIVDLMEVDVHAMNKIHTVDQMCGTYVRAYVRTGLLVGYIRQVHKKMLYAVPTTYSAAVRTAVCCVRYNCTVRTPSKRAGNFATRVSVQRKLFSSRLDFPTQFNTQHSFQMRGEMSTKHDMC